VIRAVERWTFARHNARWLRAYDAFILTAHAHGLDA
jgi:hypothetical protein